MRSIIEIFRNGAWIPAAEFEPAGKGPHTAKFEYLIDYVFGADPRPVSFALPVTVDRIAADGDGNVPICPAFLLDLVPQGRGRTYLSQELKVGEGPERDLFLAQHGAFNPIGNLRLDTAVRFYEQRVTDHQEATKGFKLEDIIRRKEEFLEHIWLHAMLSAGTTGVQGAAPKFLLTQNAEDLWFADAALGDDQAARHWLIKLPRGVHETDYAVLRNEAAYLRVAAECNVRTHEAPQTYGDMLFVQRFDRAIDSAGLHRLHQESVAALAGLRGFGLAASLFDQVEAFRPYVTDPIAETVEFIKRDILNVALRNTDNHARNTAVQQLPDGRVQLTPLFDFAPMYKDRELIVRGCKWRTKLGPELQDWDEIVDHLNFDDNDKQAILRQVKAWQPVIENLEATMLACGVDADIVNDCKPSIRDQVARLERLPANTKDVYRGGPTF